MINSKHSENSGPAKQLSLFDLIIPDPIPHLKAAMNEAVKRCSLSREQIVDEMNRLAAAAGITCNGKSKKVTVALLDKWLAPGATAYVVPLRLLPIFCRVVGSILPLQVYSSFFKGVRVISEEDHKKLVWAEAEISARRNRKAAKKLAEEVGL